MSKKIVASNVSKTFLHLNTGKRIEVLRDININIGENESVAVLGKNGAGKSTLLRMLCGSLCPTGGTINVSGKISWPVGFGGGFDPNISARDNIKFISNMMGYGYEKSQEIQDGVENFAGLDGKLDYLVSSYSSGMKSKLFFFTSIIFKFDFYLFDEISALGDSSFEGSSTNILNDMKKNSGLVCVTHNIKKVAQYCDYGYILDCGTISKKLPIAEAVESYEAL
ncbi:ATP-binding cassette domain-containing protein [Gammaproteobacteria bacterium]|nr:ATP-binding cassette domain-containing protein [Gammaproteobacteria bacterium]